VFIDCNSFYSVQFNFKSQIVFNMFLSVFMPRVNVINLFRLPHRDEIIIHRLRIGHAYLKFGHLLLGGEVPPLCLACHVELTAEHILLHFVSFTNARDVVFPVTLNSVCELFSKVAYRSIIDLIKKSGSIVTFKCTFQSEFKSFSFQFLLFVYCIVFI